MLMVNWREYEQHLQQQVKDAEENMSYLKKKYGKSIIEYHRLCLQQKKFEREMEKQMWDERMF
jgi:hypothetical protein